jgi:hypothetical protein
MQFQPFWRRDRSPVEEINRLCGYQKFKTKKGGSDASKREQGRKGGARSENR